MKRITRNFVTAGAALTVLAIILSVFILWIQGDAVLKEFPASRPVAIDDSPTADGFDSAEQPRIDRPKKKGGRRAAKKPSPPPAPEPQSAIAVVDQAARGLDWGNIVFNAPESISFAKPQRIELVLSPSLSVAELEAQLQDEAGAEAAHIQVSNRMEAQLTGAGFATVAQSPGLQAISSRQTTRWQWDVTPTQHGRQTLHLVLSAYIDVAGRDAPLVVRTFDRDIEVNITFPQQVSGFARDNWQWLWTTLIVPLAGYFWKRRKDRREIARTA